MKKLFLSLLFFKLFQVDVFCTNIHESYSGLVPIDIDNKTKGEGAVFEPRNSNEPYSAYITNGILHIKALHDVDLAQINIFQNNTLLYCYQANLFSGATADIQLPQDISGHITIEISNNDGAYLYGVTFIQ